MAEIPKPPPEPDLGALAQEMRRQFTELGKQVKEALDKVGDEVQYRFDKELGKALAQHPELYAEVRRTMRQVQKTFDKAVETLGLK
ncbi:MAG TPA: hypothetical protein VI796_04020 [Candidatus Thermoplasmatota archaeon]|nr:hypothetical protein [Candidatus Thermoplasmatota archaeon]